jgi:acetyl-CoA carboxylase biotin carboxyl carrier protein
VADAAPGKPIPFDVGTIKQLVALMSRHDLSEIDLQHGQSRLRLRRGPRSVRVVGGPAPAAAAAPAPPEAPAEAPAAAPARQLHEIKSPTPGTFYSRPKPEAPPYVQAGSRVTPDTVVGQIEAMKLFTEIPADCSGVIREVCVENAQPVEYGTVLFRVDPSA